MEKKSKFLSWLKFPSFSNKNSTKHSQETKVTENNFAPVACMTNTYSNLTRNAAGEIFLPVPCCQHCHHQSEFVNSQSLVLPYPNSCKIRYHNCEPNSSHTKYDKTKHVQTLKVNKENLSCGSHYKYNCCRKHLNYYFPKEHEFKTGSNKYCCEINKCSRKYYELSEIKKNDTCKQQSKYRSIGVNTTPQLITASRKKLPLNLNEKPVENFEENECLQFRHLTLEDDVKKRQTKCKKCFHIENQSRLLEYRHFDHLRDWHNDDKFSVMPINNSDRHLKKSRLQINSAIIQANKENKQKLETLVRHRMHNNRSLPKSWKQKTWLLDDDHKSTFADDEKSEFNDSYNAHYYAKKQTCL